MSHIHRNALLHYTDRQMYDLVNDVAAYPDYLDGCKAATIHEQTATSMIATLALEKKGVKLSFTTSNVLDEPKSIVMNLQDGPFDSFEGRWFFQDLNGEACKVVLDIQFTLANKVTGLAVKKLFDSVSNNMVDAMVQRAKEVYGD